MYNFMEQIKTRIKRWGNSYGIVVPITIINQENLEEGSEVRITIQSEKKTKVKEIFGILKGKLKRNTQEALDEIDKELWPENE